MVWTLARMIIATVGRRQARTVVKIDVIRIIHVAEYSVRFLAIESVPGVDTILVIVAVIGLMVVSVLLDRSLLLFSSSLRSLDVRNHAERLPRSGSL